MDLLRTRQVDPVHQSPQTRMYGFFTHGTVPPSRLYSSGFLSLPDHLRCLSLPKMPTGANAFEISDIQEERNREPVLAKQPEFSNVTCYIASTTCRGINSPGTG